MANTTSEIPVLLGVGNLAHSGFVFLGTVVAVLYVVYRSFDLGGESTLDSSERPDSTRLLREVGFLAVPVLLWFALAGLAATTLAGHSTLNSAIETIVLASTRAGILTALLYVLARGIEILHSPDAS